MPLCSLSVYVCSHIPNCPTLPTFYGADAAAFLREWLKHVWTGTQDVTFCTE